MIHLVKTFALPHPPCPVRQSLGSGHGASCPGCIRAQGSKPLVTQLRVLSSPPKGRKKKSLAGWEAPQGRPLRCPVVQLVEPSVFGGESLHSKYIAV